MFENLFTDAHVIACYRDAPLCEDRLRYLAHCASAGYRYRSLRTIANRQRQLVRLLDLQAGDSVSMARIQAAAREWARPGVRRSMRPAGREARTSFVGQAVRWLRFAGLLEEPETVRHAHAGEVATFVAWMQEERGWSSETIHGCSCTVDRFFRRLETLGVELASVRITEIDQAIARYHARGCSRRTVRDYAQHLRTFFRFAERQGWCMPGLAAAIIPGRMHPGETIPKGLDRDEVGGLQLDDLDWVQETLRVRCPKPGRTQLYPLSRSVGQTIVRYLREVRPARPDRTLFLSLNAPLRPITRDVITHVVHSRLGHLGVTGKRRGPHALRHAAAQRLLDHGLSMKQVGDYLGHRSVAATSVYAKLRLDALREVAAIDPEGLA